MKNFFDGKFKPIIADAILKAQRVGKIATITSDRRCSNCGNNPFAAMAWGDARLPNFCTDSDVQPGCGHTFVQPNDPRL